MTEFVLTAHRWKKYQIAFSCGHWNYAYSPRENVPERVSSPSLCFSCIQEPVEACDRLTIVNGGVAVTVIPMLAEKRRPVFFVWVKRVSDGEWISSHLANHPMHAFWMIDKFYPNATYIEPEKVVQGIGV